MPLNYFIMKCTPHQYVIKQIRTTLNYSTSLSPLTSSYSRVPQFLSWHSIINFLYFVFLHLFNLFIIIIIIVIIIDYHTEN